LKYKVLNRYSLYQIDSFENLEISSEIILFRKHVIDKTMINVIYPEKKVAIVYNYIAHYRIPIFNILSSCEINSYTIIAGTETDISLKTADPILSEIDIRKGGIRWIRIKNIWIFKVFLWQKGLLKHCRSNNFDSIIFLGNMYYLSTWIAAWIAKRRGKKVIFWTHGFIRQENNLKGFIRISFYKLADEILTYGQRAKDILISKGIEEDKIRLIYNSLDFFNQKKIIDKVTPVYPEKLFKYELYPTFGFIGRITKQKRIDILIDVLELLHSNDIKANLLIIGDGELKSELQQRVNSKKLSEYVCFFGACYDETIIYQLLKSLKVIVSPGEVGLTAIHGMTYGIPIITHNRFDKQMPEFECIRPGLTGDFFDYNNPVISLSQLLSKWLQIKDQNRIENECKKIIDQYYNPLIQKEIFNSVV